MLKVENDRTAVDFEPGTYFFDRNSRLLSFRIHSTIFQIEIDSKETLSFDLLFDYVHPSTQTKERGFAKPPGPPQRGHRRVTKAVG